MKGLKVLRIRIFEFQMQDNVYFFYLLDRFYLIELLDSVNLKYLNLFK